MLPSHTNNTVMHLRPALVPVSNPAFPALPRPSSALPALPVFLAFPAIASAPPHSTMAREEQDRGLLYRDVGQGELNYNKQQLWKALM